MPVGAYVLVGVLLLIVALTPMPRGLRITSLVAVLLGAALLVYVYEVPGVSN